MNEIHSFRSIRSLPGTNFVPARERITNERNSFISFLDPRNEQRISLFVHFVAGPERISFIRYPFLGPGTNNEWNEFRSFVHFAPGQERINE